MPNTLNKGRLIYSRSRNLLLLFLFLLTEFPDEICFVKKRYHKKVDPRVWRENAIFELPNFSFRFAKSLVGSFKAQMLSFYLENSVPTKSGRNYLVDESQLPGETLLLPRSPGFVAEVQPDQP